jgi:predicted phage-related endonuclease
MIADLTTLGLPKEAVEARVHAIGGSDANIILSGKPERILRLWEEKTGRAEPEDLSGNLAVVMGQFTEPLNAAWFQLQTGLEITRRNVSQICDIADWRAATLDGVVGEDEAVWEAKHTNPFSREQEALAQWMPQLHHNMDVAHIGVAHLSMFRGNSVWSTYRIDYDPAYGAALLNAEWDFWMAVLSDEPPVPYPAVPIPAAVMVKEVDMTGDNTWAACADEWLRTRDAAKRNEEAKDGLKRLIAPDVAIAFGHGVEFRRDKRGALRISALEA